MKQEGSDSINLWFYAAEEMGEYIGIRFGHMPPGTTEPEWTFLRHTDFDGIGGLAHIFRQKGVTLGRLPQIRYPAAPSALTVFKLVPKFLRPRHRIKWLPLGATRQCGPHPPPAVAWHLFDELATLQMRRVCRMAGVTVNSFLLKHLTKAIRPFLEDQAAVVPWMVPVNLRGKLVRERDTANFSSYVGVKVKSYETPHDVHRNIYAALGRHEHWANWYGFYASRCLTQGMRKFLIAKEWALSQWNLGSFSNLGDWDTEKEITQPACLGDWFFCPPVLRCQLVGAGCVTFQNRLTLVIQAHPELTVETTILKTWMQNWVKEIEMDLASGLTDPTTFFWRKAPV
ncbi:MAG TPA: hypothetical protein VMA35_04985 [Candidatus Sulfopaludibacter sp.]|nr:hypothetical protein [Candidatus Sulfopaludibacter sp.]